MILLVNGPDLDLLAGQERGGETLADVERRVSEACAGHGLGVKAFQSNWEGAILDFLLQHRQVARGVILNAGALAHTSRALHDCLAALPCPTIEVQLENVHARETWRRESVIAPAALGQISGLGTAGYTYAALHLCALAAGRADEVAGGAPERALGAAAPLDQQAAPRARAPAPELSYTSGGEGVLSPEDSEEIPVDLNARGDYEP